MSTKLTEALTKVVAEISEFSSDERRRIIAGALAILGDSVPSANTDGFVSPVAAASPAPEATLGTMPQLAQRWIKKHGISDAQIEEAFHLDNGKAALILGEMPGQSKREKTVNAYILTGIGSLLGAGTADFTDEAARSNCETAGCFDAPNHGKYLKLFGNQITGSKNAGWTLTAPGQTAGAALLKSKTGGNE